MQTVYLVLNRTCSNTHFLFPSFLRVSLLYLKENNFVLHFKKKMFVCIFWGPVQPLSFTSQTGRAPRGSRNPPAPTGT